MASREFKEGDLVWAKLKGFPLWPGRIVNPPSRSEKLKNSNSYYVNFFGSEDFAWVSKQDIQCHTVDLLKSFNKKKPRALCNGVKALRKYLERSSSETFSEQITQDEEKDLEADVADVDIYIKTEPLSDEDEKSNEKVTVPLKKRKHKSEKTKNVTEKNEKVGVMEENNEGKSQENEVKPSSEGGENGNKISFPEEKVSKSAPELERGSVILSPPKKRLEPEVNIKSHNQKHEKILDPTEVNIGASSSKRAKTTFGVKRNMKKVQNLTHRKGSRSFSNKTPSVKSEKKVYKKRQGKLTISKLIESLKSGKESTEETVRSEIKSDVGDDKQDHPKFGVVGLSENGKAIAIKLIEAGYDVTLWKEDLSIHDCKNLLDLGPKTVNFPEDLIVNCDVTFSCAEDSNISEKIVFGQYGILEGFEKIENGDKSSKGYVEMGNIDPDHSWNIGEAIKMKKGFFLEVPIVRIEEENGTFLFLAAGHPLLYQKIFPFLKLIGKTSIYINSQIGYASRMSSIVNVLPGTICAALAEAISLAKRLELQEVFLDFLENGPLGCKSIMEKANRMIESNFHKEKAEVSVKLMQEQMASTLMIGDSTHISTPVLAAANETFKRARNQKYSEENISAVYKVA